ncbi:hypothetical protein BCR44DRAFT_1443755, partial [Catenaria anguillulae PL171]
HDAVYDRQRNQKVWRNLAHRDFESMPQAQIQSVTVVVPADLAKWERNRVILTLKRVAQAWEGMTFKVGMTGEGDEGERSRRRNAEAIQEMVNRLRKFGDGEVAVEWLGRVNAGQS